MSERWLPVVGYEGLYEVSNRGRVRGVPRVMGGRWGKHSVQGKTMATIASPKGHLSVHLSNNGRLSHKLVHRLVLEAFVGPAPKGTEGCHNNGEPTDNRLENLRWDTRSENIRDSVRHGTHRQSRMTTCLKGHEFSRVRTDGARRCDECDRERGRELDAAIRKAHMALGISQREYVAHYGRSKSAALAVIAAERRRLIEAATGRNAETLEANLAEYGLAIVEVAK